MSDLFNPRRYALGLIPCTKTKNPRGLSARTVYAGGPFSLMLRHSMQRCDRVIIMSALHGLVELETPMVPYEAYLPALGPHERALLGRKVREQEDILRWWDSDEKILSYLPRAYHEFLVENLPKASTDRMVRPYRSLGSMTLYKILSNEIRNYERLPARR